MLLRIEVKVRTPPTILCISFESVEDTETKFYSDEAAIERAWRKIKDLRRNLMLREQQLTKLWSTRRQRSIECTSFSDSSKHPSKSTKIEPKS